MESGRELKRVHNKSARLLQEDELAMTYSWVTVKSLTRSQLAWCLSLNTRQLSPRGSHRRHARKTEAKLDSHELITTQFAQIITQRIVYLLLAFKVVENHREPFIIELISSAGDPWQLLSLNYAFTDNEQTSEEHAKRLQLIRGARGGCFRASLRRLTHDSRRESRSKYVCVFKEREN